MKIVKMRANHVETPLGYELSDLTLSWKVEEAEGKKTRSAQVRIYADAQRKNLLHDSAASGREKIDSLGYCPGIELQPRTRYYWSVEVETDSGCRAEGFSWFETGKMQEPWQASWISSSGGEHPLLKREFSLPTEVRSARAYVCGLGLYELYVNGQKAGNEYLTPYCNDYRFWKQVQVYDVTALLRRGENAVGSMLGNGWYKGRFGYESYERCNLFGDRFAFLCELHIELADGEKLCIFTDESWKWKPSFVLESGIYDGETIDARLLDADWCQPGRGNNFQPVERISLSREDLRDRMSVPVRITERLPVAEVIRTPKGETVLDFGQEITGWVEFTCRLPQGEKIRLQYGEILQNGCFYRDNLRTAKAEFVYTSDGKERYIRPHFTFYGFRYVRVEGVEVAPEDFVACVLHSDLDFTGNIETSDARINRLFQNAFWSQRGNFLDVPTDCPQRDERMGWTGDAQIFAATASFNMYTPAFYAKYMQDALEEQIHLYNGSVPHAVPMMIEDTSEFGSHGAAAWADMAIIIPWTMYVFYGDKALLQKQYANMQAWAEYLLKEDAETGGKRLRHTGFHFGDWLALDTPEGAEDDRFGGTDPYLVASACYFYVMNMIAKAATVLGKSDDAEKYGKAAEEIRQAIQKEYFLPGGLCRFDTQTAYVLGLYMHLVPKEDRPGALRRLEEKLRENNMHLSTGFVGTPYLCPTLSQEKRDEEAYQLLFNDDFPSWLYEVDMGATTVWERWNSVLPDGHISGTGMNSLNHYAYGSIAEWMYRYMCGIQPREDAPGFRSFRLQPRPSRRLQWAKASFDSPVGRIESSWEYKDGIFRYCCSVPFDAEAELTLPFDGETCINGDRTEDRSFHLTPGRYVFEQKL